MPSIDPEFALVAVIREFGESKNFSQRIFRFNKATLFSWFVFLLAANKRLGVKIDSKLQTKILSELEALKKGGQFSNTNESYENLMSTLFLVFEDRSRARVYNVDSVLIRDIMFWVIFLQFSQRNNIDFTKDAKLKNLDIKFSESAKKENITISFASNFFDEIITSENWGMRI